MNGRKFIWSLPKHLKPIILLVFWCFLKHLISLITTDLQEWLAEKVFPRAAASGLKKIAFVVPDDLFASVSVEQLMEEDTKKTFITRYFKDEIRARQWLSN